MKKIVTISIAIMLILLLMTPVVGCQERPPPQPAPTPMPAPAPAPAPSPTPEPPTAPTPPPTLPKPVPTPPAKLESVSIMPIEVAAGETQQLEAIATDEKGNQLSEFDAAWKMIDEEAGSITETGLFTAGAVVRSFADAVEVKVTKGDVIRTAVASVTVTPGPLEQVVIAPNTAEIGIEMTQRFVAVGADKYGNRISNLVFSWSVENGGGTIDGTGLFTAGVTSGNYTDTVKVEATRGGVTRSAMANVTVAPDRILFISGDITEVESFTGTTGIYEFKRADIYVIDADGSNVKQLTDTSVNEGKFSCSPDGRHIVYDSGGVGGGEIMLMNTDGRQKVCLVDKDNASPEWSPDGTRIVFSSYSSKEEDWDIYVIDADGGNLTQLTDTSYYDESIPSWSPDGTQIVFSLYRHKEKTSDIYVIDADGGNLTQLTYTRRGGIPDWSPDGTRIMFSVRNETWVMNADGSDQEKLLFNVGTNMSPDGSQIAFASDGICVINADMTDKRQLTKNKELIGGTQPAWSPDGSKIIFVSNEYKYRAVPSGTKPEKQHKRSEICVMDADGKNQTSLIDYSDRLITNPQYVPRKRGVEVNEESVIIPAPAP